MPMVGGLYSGVEYRPNPPSSMDAQISEYVSENQKDRIVCVLMLPELITDYLIGEDVEEMPVFDATFSGSTVTIGNYVPRNKKLLSYPYAFLTVDTTTEAKEFRYELFGNRQVAFRAFFLISPNPEVVICPLNYNGSGGSTGFRGGANFSENVKLTGYPQCAMSINSYEAWLAQNSGNMYLMSAGAGIATVGGIMSGNVPAILGGVGTMGKMVADAARESSHGSTSRGNTCASAIAVAGGLVPYFKEMGVTEETAAMLDDYFDRFGYICNRVKVPVRNNRPHWTYLKTKDCTIHGGVPVEYAKKICEIYDKGITWWNMSGLGSTVGDYSQNNAPV